MAYHAAMAAEGDAAKDIVWYSPLILSTGDGARSVKPHRAIGPDEPVGDYLFAYDGLMQTSTLVLSRTLFARVGFDPTLRNLQDLDLCLRLESAGARFRMVPDAQSIWHDDLVDGRISTATRAGQVARWAESRKEMLSERAYHGFRARYLAMRLVRSNPPAALGMIGIGLRNGGLSPFRAASILARGAMPGTYSRARRWWARRSARTK
jgi:hypothetical protein